MMKILIAIMIIAALSGCVMNQEKPDSFLEQEPEDQYHLADWGYGPGHSVGACGSMVQDLEGPEGITATMPVECSSFYLYKGYPTPDEQIVNPLDKTQEATDNTSN